MEKIEILREVFKIKRRLLELLKLYENKILSFDEIDTIKKEIYDLYVNYLKLYNLYSGNKLSSKKDWFYTNVCFHYALNLPTPDLFLEVYDRIFLDDFNIEVGNISELPYIYDYEYTLDIFLRYFEADLKVLGIEKYPSTINSPLKHNGFKVAIFYDDTNKDYHFIRQNSDGLWSQKFGLDTTICISDNPLNFLNNSPIKNSKKTHYEYIKTLELVKPCKNR